ncbi:unnamed protein product [Adineta steineri]|uniref:NHL repeat containing protein n=1 Tax=Adineta steineri TaxID=433720 RepID=A0A819J2D2_9BILA|nr:unnamed protein product [Adineta steineri]CAF3923345.1 unnamed protein product [Adineta steineri]
MMVLFIVYFYLGLYITLVNSQNLGVSFNQPKFSPCATWNITGITFSNSSAVGTNPGTVFIDKNDTIYVTDRTSNRVQVWQNGSKNVTRTISGGLNDSLGLFVSNNGDIYVDNGYTNNQIDKWMINSTNSTVSGGNMTQIAAGTGTPGNTAYMLNWPRGIFVDINSNLYVADGNNNRIQKFSYGELSATTIVGTGASATIDLNGPSAVVLDANGYLFIVDQNNNRIIGSGPYGYRCLVGCSEQTGSASTQLNQPYSMSFDSHGNIYVTDKNNGRIQLFNLATNTNSCAIPSTQTPLLTSTRSLTTLSTKLSSTTKNPSIS